MVPPTLIDPFTSVPVCVNFNSSESESVEFVLQNPDSEPDARHDCDRTDPFHVPVAEVPGVVGVGVGVGAGGAPAPLVAVHVVLALMLVQVPPIRVSIVSVPVALDADENVPVAVNPEDEL